MGRPADIAARLRFIFPGCLKQAGAPSDGRRTAKEEVPLTGQREEPAPQGHPAKVGPRTEAGGGLRLDNNIAVRPAGAGGSGGDGRRLRETS